MKELSIEEKVKRYDEAIEKLRSLHDNYDTVSTLIDVKEELENIFPELAESEDDRIRKELVEFIKSRGGFKGEWLAWLEKQGVQKPAEWSEEDEDAIAQAIIALEDMYDEDDPHRCYSGYNLSFKEAAERLKSLRPQNRWKPSDGQIKALEDTFVALGGYDNSLRSLINDLKSLK